MANVSLLKPQVDEATREAIRKRIQSEWIARIKATNVEIDLVELRKGIDFLWGLAGFDPPEIGVYDNPTLAHDAATAALDPGESGSDLFCSYGDISDYGWISHFEFLYETGDPNLPNLDPAVIEQSLAYMNLLKSGLYTMIQLDKKAFVVKKPQAVHYNDANRLHNLAGPAIEWPGTPGTRIYAINGRQVDADIFEEPITADRFIRETNTENRAAMYELLGPEKTMDLLGAILIDERTLVHRDGRLDPIKLYKTKEKFPELDAKLAWVVMECPSTGTRYAIDVEPGFENVLDAHASLSIFDKNELLNGYSKHS